MSFQTVLEKGHFSGLKDWILASFPCYEFDDSKEEYFSKIHHQGILYVDNSQDFYTNLFLNVSNTKALRVWRMLIKENKLKFTEKLRNFARIYFHIMEQNVYGLDEVRFEKNLNIFLVFLRFLKLFAEEPERFQQESLNHLQEEAKKKYQQLKTLYEAFDSRDSKKRLQILLQDELFPIMTGLYLIYWTAGRDKKKKTFKDENELLIEHIRLLMPSFTDTIRVEFPLFWLEHDPLKSLLGELRPFVKPQSFYQDLKSCFEVKMNQEKGEFTLAPYSLKFSSTLQELNWMIQENSHFFKSVKMMYLKLNSISHTTMEERPPELNLEFLKVKIQSSNTTFEDVEEFKYVEDIEDVEDAEEFEDFEGFVDFLSVQKSIKVLHIRFKAANTKDEQIEYFAEGLENLLNLTHAKFDFLNCYFVSEESIQILADKLRRIKGFKSLRIYAAGCSKVTRLWDLGEHVSLEVEPVVMNPGVDERKNIVNWD